MRNIEPDYELAAGHDNWKYSSPDRDGDNTPRTCELCDHAITDHQPHNECQKCECMNFSDGQTRLEESNVHPIFKPILDLIRPR